MTEKDLDIAIEKCERIMEMDTRTMQNPVSENGYIFEKVYDLLKFLRQFEFETGGMDDTISRRAAIDAAIEAVDDWDGGTNIGRQKRIEKYINALPSAQPSVFKTEIVGDAISRQAAIEVVRTAKGKGDAHRMLIQLSSAQPGWIPVPERLPEYGTTVLTCNHDGEYEINHIIDEEDREWFYDGAVAWMPLPKPWEGEKP